MQMLAVLTSENLVTEIMQCSVLVIDALAGTTTTIRRIAHEAGPAIRQSMVTCSDTTLGWRAILYLDGVMRICRGDHSFVRQWDLTSHKKLTRRWLGTTLPCGSLLKSGCQKTTR